MPPAISMEFEIGTRERFFMRLHVFQHVPFENPGCILPWAEHAGASVRWTRFYRGEAPPEPDTYDWLIVMGGPMSVYQQGQYPWLTEEIGRIRQAIDGGKTVLGICLGAQLIAAALNAAVGPHRHREIGWFAVTRSVAAEQTYLAPILPETLNVLHWHGDTFGLPPGAVHLACSQGCKNQGFLFGERVIGLQFHLEMTRQGLQELIRHCGRDIGRGRWEQPPAQMMEDAGRFAAANDVMVAMLDALAKRTESPGNGIRHAIRVP